MAQELSGPNNLVPSGTGPWRHLVSGVALGRENAHKRGLIDCTFLGPGAVGIPEEHFVGFQRYIIKWQQ